MVRRVILLAYRNLKIKSDQMKEWPGGTVSCTTVRRWLAGRLVGKSGSRSDNNICEEWMGECTLYKRAVGDMLTRTL